MQGRRRALNEEIAYWADHLAKRGGKYGESYAYRFDPEAEVADPAVRRVLELLPEEEVSILDVGAGPAPSLGYRFPGKTLSISAVDPLAREYNLLLDRLAIVPPVQAEPIEGERLVEAFGCSRFDIAYAHNAVDHAVDPVLVIENMVEIVRPGGYVILRHGRNEGAKRRYRQLHQWNFDEHDGDFVVWRVGREANVTDLLRGRADVECEPDPRNPGSLVCVLKKLDATESPGPEAPRP